MKTDDLISMLANGPEARVTSLPLRRIGLQLAGALLVSLVLMLLFLGVRPDLTAAMVQSAFWGKVLYVAALTLAGTIACRRLSVPGARISDLPAFLVAPVLLMLLAAGVSLASTAPEQRLALFLGSTWRVCPLLIAALSLPIFAATLAGMRAMAPTRLRFAGAAAGFTAGAAAATIYCLHCPEMASPFVAFWYLLGVLLPAAAGALIGPRVLAW